MELDLAETPIFDKIEIFGTLIFKNSIDIHLHAKKILLRGGSLIIGSASEPYLKQGKITLHGRKEEPTIAIESQGIEAGNKIIANLGTLKMFGKKRLFSVTRLNKSCTKGDTEITVDPKLDLVKGDRIALAATSFKYDAGEENFVESYDAASGVIKLKTALKFYHYGASKSTADRLYGVDMRGEVISLTRNI
jgi:hypothetical protein